MTQELNQGSSYTVNAPTTKKLYKRSFQSHFRSYREIQGLMLFDKSQQTYHLEVKLFLIPSDSTHLS